MLMKIGGALTVLAAGIVAVGAHAGGEMLHPGLAPWSKERHTHGPAGHAHEHGHEPEHDRGDHQSAADGKPMAHSHAGVPGLSSKDAGEFLDAPTTANAAADGRSAPTGDGSAHPHHLHNHSEHVHTHTAPTALAIRPAGGSPSSGDDSPGR